MDRVRILWFSFLGLWSLTLLYFGAVRPWAIGATCAAMSVLFGLSLVLLKEPLRLSRGAVGLLAAFAALFVLQLLPLPFLFPFAARVREAHGVGVLWPGTADAWRTLLFIAQFASYGLAGLLVLKLRQNGLRSSWVLQGVLAVLGLEAAFGLVRLFAGWPNPPFHAGASSGVDSAAGTLVNRNHFAGLMGMGFVVAVAVAAARFTWPARRVGDPERPGPGRRLESGLGWALLAGLFAAAIILSKSRGGALAAVAGLALVPFFHRGKASLGGLAAIVVVAAVAITAANPTGLLSRFDQLDPFELTAQNRWELWTTTSSAALRQPFLGFGVGSHATAYHPFQPPTMVGQPEYAHNEYVNFLFEGGFVGLALLLGALGYWFYRVLRALRAVPGTDRLPLASALGAVSVIAVHSLFDFDLRITSIGLLAGALMGLGGSVSRRGEPRPRFGWMAVADGLAVAAALFFLPLDPGPAVETRDEARLVRALGLSPLDYRPAWQLARASEDRGDLGLADRQLALAADLWPPKAELQREAGLRLLEGDPARAATCFHRLFLQRPGAVAEVMGRIWDPDRPVGDYEALLPPSPAAVSEFAAFLVRKGRWELAGQVFDRLADLDVAACDRFAAALSEAGQWGLEARVRERRLALRTDGAGCAAAARAWRNLGALDRAAELALTATRVAPREGPLHALKAEIEWARGEKMPAVESYGEAARLSPSEAGYRTRRAELYGALSMHAMAADEIREALRLRPGDRALTLWLARTQVAAGDLPAARRTVDAFLAAHPADDAARGYRKSLGD